MGPGRGLCRGAAISSRGEPVPDPDVASGTGSGRGTGTGQRTTTMKFHEMTFPQLRQVPRDATVIVAPIAACEQHSRHLPTFTDTILVTGVAEGVEERMQNDILLLPTLWFGASSHHLRLGATLSAEVDTHMAMLLDLLTPLLEDGFKRVLVLN